MRSSNRFVSFVSCLLGAVMAVPTASAGLSLQNGDFSSGLTAWTVEYGSVTDGGGFALFQEDPAFLTSTLSQQFTIPAGATQLSFDVLMSAAPGGDTDPFVAPDAFTASLLNPLTLDPLVFNSGYSDFFYMDNTGGLETIAAVSGSMVALDVSGLAGLDAYLVFNLVAGEDGMTTTVNLDNVNVSVVPLPGALLLGLLGITSAAGLLHRHNKQDPA